MKKTTTINKETEKRLVKTVSKKMVLPPRMVLLELIDEAMTFLLEICKTIVKGHVNNIDEKEFCDRLNELAGKHLVILHQTNNDEARKLMGAEMEEIVGSILNGLNEDETEELLTKFSNHCENDGYDKDCTDYAVERFKKLRIKGIDVESEGIA